MTTPVKNGHGGTRVVPRNSVPPRRAPRDKWSKVWEQAKKLRRGGKALAVDPSKHDSTLNGLHCAVYRARTRGLIPDDIIVHHKDGTAYLHR